MRPDRIGIWKCCNKRRFNLQDRKKRFKRKLLIYAENHVTKRLVRSRFWSPTKYVDSLPKSTLEPFLLPREDRRGGQGVA